MEIDKGGIITIAVIIALASSQGSLSFESPAGRAGGKVIGGAKTITDKAAGIVTSPGAAIPDTSGPANAAIPMPNSASNTVAVAPDMSGLKSLVPAMTAAPVTSSSSAYSGWYAYCIATYQGTDWTHPRKSPGACAKWAKARSQVAP